MSRPRRLTYTEALARIDALTREASLLARALADMTTGAVYWDEETRLDTGERYTFYLTRPTAPDGGIIVVVWSSPVNDYDSVTAHNADELLSNILGAGWPPACYPALDKLRAAWWEANERKATP